MLLQLAATIIALLLVRRTKFNSLWIILAIALGLMTASRILQFVHYVPRGDSEPWNVSLIWTGIAISVCMVVVLVNAWRLVAHNDEMIFRKGLLSKRIMSATLRTEERERTRFSKELHDGLGPLLSSAKMSLSAMSREGKTAADLEIMDGAAYVIDEAIRSLREISNNLSPHVLNEFGLGRGVGNFLRRVSGLHEMKIDYRTNLRDERFDADVEVILYRVICELVNNSLKHSGATEASLSLQYDGVAITLDYGDNGRGFSPSADGGEGMGLSNMSSRINTLNGVLNIKSSRGAGMSASAKVIVNHGRTN